MLYISMNFHYDIFIINIIVEVLQIYDLLLLKEKIKFSKQPKRIEQ